MELTPCARPERSGGLSLLVRVGHSKEREMELTPCARPERSGGLNLLV